jgi:hypothetical protein
MEATADYSVLADKRLVAYLWRREAGHLRRAGVRGETSLAEIAYADIFLFDAQGVTTFREVVAASADFDALLFKLGLEGFEVVAGEVQPRSCQRRF